MKYLHERRKELGGYVPQRRVNCPPLKAPTDTTLVVRVCRT